MQIRPFYWLALSFLGYYCAYGVFLPFFPAWLKSQQYGEEMIGLIIGSAYIFRFIGGLFFSSLIKKADHIINSLRLLALASAIIMATMSLVAHNFWLLFSAIGLLPCSIPPVCRLVIPWLPHGNVKSDWTTARFG
ncbi:3-phenylpropionic acid transporter [Rodentibacter pneumotropicus]|uniref:3-phenylpropionic acid transporter n=1 Tax=Rodentibacter pneumotropicus TaxID=758 RepID=A0A3S4TTK8_9PAST|nr:3-phenylpropionic acid transporter [Rodentibacter pneumotropicus]